MKLDKSIFYITNTVHNLNRPQLALAKKLISNIQQMSNGQFIDDFEFICYNDERLDTCSFIILNRRSQRIYMIRANTDAFTEYLTSVKACLLLWILKENIRHYRCFHLICQLDSSSSTLEPISREIHEYEDRLFSSFLPFVYDVEDKNLDEEDPHVFDRLAVRVTERYTTAIPFVRAWRQYAP